MRGGPLVNLPYIIAEIGLAHEGNIAKAMELVWQAKEAGANAVKFQAVWADRLVSKTAPTYFHQEGIPAETQHAFFARSDGLTRADYEYLAAFAKKCGVDFLCTVFDVESVHWIAPLVPVFKVASADITNLPLLEAIAGYGKPVYLSAGAADWNEIASAIAPLALRDCHVTLLHCVLSYPTPSNQANLGVIISFDGGEGFIRGADAAGYSDHTLFNLDVLTTAWLLGASVIEKHFTLDKSLPGNDHYHSMDPTDLRALVAKLKELQAMIGDGEKRVLPIEEAARLNARQSWHAARDLPVRHRLTEGDLVLKRPGTGLPPSEQLVGRYLGMALRADEPMTALHFSPLELVTTT